MNRPHSTCTACEQPFTDHSWIDRHSITDTDQHHLDPGDYHDDCCPLCSMLDEGPR
jgi:hypothetical protein